MQKLSICSIVGNESRHIKRFIESFSKIADEFVLVRAIGSSEPDDTLEVATELCQGLGIPLIRGEYRNAQDERAAWPHVDDFAAARQQSFDLASGDWKTWADLDDVWPEKEENSDLMEKLKEGDLEDYAWIHIDYVVPDARAMVARERFAQTGANPKWSGPVHEGMQCAGESYAYLTGAQIVHAPLNDKKGSAERNLRILEFATKHPELYPDQATLWFYLHRELMYLDRRKESLAAAEKALSLLPKGITDSPQVTPYTILYYEILLITAGVALDAGDASDARARAHGAVNVMPGRREAYALLAQIEHRAGNFQKMLAYTSAMRGIEEPTGLNRTWTQRDTLYSWQGAFMHHQALRLCDRPKDAEKLEQEVFKLEGSAITLIHPTMLRPDLAIQTYQKFMAAASNPGAVQYIFAIDEQDEYTKQVLKPYETVICPRGARKAANYARKFATGNRVEVIGDNFDPGGQWLVDKSAIPQPAQPWKLEARDPDFTNLIKKEGIRYVICAKEAKSPDPDFQPQHCHYELGWEQGTSHLYAKMFLSQEKLRKDDIIVTLPGRQFLYESCFDVVLTWKEFCEEYGDGKRFEYGKPYRDASSHDTLDLVEYFERNGHRYDSVYFNGPGSAWNGGAWDLIQSFRRSPIKLAEDFLLMSLRKRPHESRRNTKDEFGAEVLRAVREATGLPIFLVGLNLPVFNIDGVTPCPLQEFATLMQLPQCKAILGPHSGPNGLAGLLAPKDKPIIIFPQEFCPSINSNYPSGMGKCLNLNGNIRHWLPVGASPSDIAAKAREVIS